MRELIYAVEGKAANLKTFAMDEPGHGGACHNYSICIANPLPLEEGVSTDSPLGQLERISFQNGPINADGNGINGVQIEDLLAICIDRLEGFQSGSYKSAYNGNALHHARKALEELNNRTKERISRNVEGTHTV